MARQPQYLIALRPEPGWAAPPAVLLRQALKRLLRGYGMRCLWAIEVEDPTVTISELADLVKKMRDTQKAYFTTRVGIDECKRLEKQVDAAVASVLEPTLFPAEEDRPS